MWAIPESDCGVLPADLEGTRVLELGCGTGYVSAWLARAGAFPVGLDVSPGQLASAARFQEEFDLHFPLVRAAAERAPFPAASFDLVISEYGAAIWSDPHRWIPEAARLLRPGGRLIFLGDSILLVMCQFDDGDRPADATLKRPQFGMHRVVWPDDPGIEFHMSHGDWIRLLRRHGFVVEDLLELRPAQDATTPFPYVDLAWARQWPCEEVWKARKA
ncbi:MAG: methyltransferase domain-containing protein [Actinomycetota bacterium]|nr:methyltransferase domain-containing protein [Actinomycetota bacterium]